MSDLKIFKTVQDRVQVLLEKYPETRDDYKTLFLAYNCQFNGLKEVLGMEAYLKFKEWFMDDETINIDTLTRARRKVQEQNPELSGEKASRLLEEKKHREYFSQEKKENESFDTPIRS